MIFIISLFTALAFSWGITCGIFYLIALCFDVVFSLKIATGVWLIIFCLLRLIKRVSKAIK